MSARLKFTVSFYDLATYSGIRDLRTEKLGRLVTICGTVTRTTDIKPELLVATWKCASTSKHKLYKAFCDIYIDNVMYIYKGMQVYHVEDRYIYIYICI